jgi:hypothetical protein
MALARTPEHQEQTIRFHTLDRDRDGQERAGIAHERTVINQIESLRRIACYHGVKGLVHGQRFEMDLLLVLPPANAIIAEVKSYRGHLSFSSEKGKWLQTGGYNDATRTISDPFDQLERVRQLFTKSLGPQAAHIQVNYCVIMTNFHNATFCPTLEREITQNKGARFAASAKLFRKGVAKYLDTVKGVAFSEQALTFMAILAAQGVQPVLFDKSVIFPEPEAPK